MEMDGTEQKVPLDLTCSRRAGGCARENGIKEMPKTKCQKIMPKGGHHTKKKFDQGDEVGDT